MKKITAILIVFCFIFSTFMIFPSRVDAIGQHEASDGTTNGTIPIRHYVRQDGQPGDGHSIWKNGSYVYVAYQTNGILAYTYDGSTFTYKDKDDIGGYYFDVWANSTYVFATTGAGKQLLGYTFNENATEEFWLKGQISTGVQTGYGVWSDGTYIYVANAWEGIEAFTFDGSTFTSIDEQWDGGAYLDVWGDGTYIYTASDTDGIKAYTFNGVSFTLKDEQDDGGNYVDVWGDGSYIYSATRTGGLRAYSFDGSSFTLIDTSTDSTRYEGVFTDGNYIYASCYDEGIKIYTFDGTDFLLEQSKSVSGYVHRCHTFDDDYLYVSRYSYGISAYSRFEKFIVTRDVGTNTESNNFTFTPSFRQNSSVNLLMPVSNDVQGIIDVTNNTDSILATEVNNSGELINNTFWYDSANQMVWIRTINLTLSTSVNWTINCSYGMTFNLIIPPYLTVGQYFHSSGFIEDSTGQAVSGIIATTRLLYSNGTDALPVNPKHNCTGGNYKCTFSTSVLSPGIYSVSIEFTDPGSGITFKEGSTLYLSYPGGSGYSDAMVFFNFYNTNEALGLPRETLKVYINDIRQQDDTYNSYTGEIINVTIKDYYNTTLFTNNYTIDHAYTYIDLGITFHSYKFCNLNEEDYMISLLKENGSRWWERGICPFETVEYVIPSGNYTVRAYNSTNVDIFNFSDIINSSRVYLIYGTNLSLIIDGQSVITDYLENGTEYFNGSFDGIYENLTGIDDLLNRSIVVFNFYNTNQGLGLDRETLKIFVNGTRLIGNLYYGFNNTIINLTIKDFYNFTLYQGDYTINEPFEFIDLGLTFHSWKFGNLQNIPYMVSLLKEGASRWWERGVMPYSDVEFMLPSGNYTLRIYDDAYNEIHNQSYVVNNSRLYAIAGGSLVLLINGQSVIRGQLLELLATLDYALTPDVEIISYNPPMIRSCFEKKGMPLGDNVWVVDPIYNIQATTRQETFGNYINSTALIPGNGSVANGTITILKDTMYISGNGSVSWVNITYTDNGTLYQNTTYILSKLDLYGQNLTINASCDINVQRDVDYNQMKHFGWVVYGDTGEHRYTIDVGNPFNNAPIYDVYVYVAFSNESTPDENTVQIIDIANGNLELTRDEHFKTGGSGIEFFILSLPANSTREFALSYYWSDYSQLNYDTDIIYVDDYKTKQSVTFDDKFYNSFTKTWVNDKSTTFRGEIIIALDFAKSNEIEPTSVHIWDAKNSRYLNRSMFYYGTGSIRISSEAIGDVSPGGGNEFTVYFRFMEYPGADPTEWHLNSIIGYLGPIPVTFYFFVFLIAIGVIGVGIISIILSDTKKKTWKGKLLIGIGIFVLFIFYILQAQGI